MLLIVGPQVDFINGSLPVAGAAMGMAALAGYVFVLNTVKDLKEIVGGSMINILEEYSRP